MSTLFFKLNRPPVTTSRKHTSRKEVGSSGVQKNHGSGIKRLEHHCQNFVKTTGGDLDMRSVTNIGVGNKRKVLCTAARGVYAIC